MPRLWVVAGPNGAGKTTLVMARLALRITVVNPDVIAAGLPRIDGRLDERQAGEIAIRQRRRMIGEGADFAIETTLSGSGPLRLMSAAKAAGYDITLIYVGLSRVELSASRVMDRVSRGGHVVPMDAIERRFPDTLSKLGVAVALADRVYVFDNSGPRRRLLLTRDNGRNKFVSANLPVWARTALSAVI